MPRPQIALCLLQLGYVRSRLPRPGSVIEDMNHWAIAPAAPRGVADPVLATCVIQVANEAG